MICVVVSIYGKLTAPVFNESNFDEKFIQAAFEIHYIFDSFTIKVTVALQLHWLCLIWYVEVQVYDISMQQKATRIISSRLTYRNSFVCLFVHSK